ncbi:zinc finger protein 27-like isoform X2 [Pungitius pungitius]|uniref:zinc finger protein 27-like isoform X2 n=1 Tax=Pungitius pungitius TaxID=134920 RepID=UPI002E14F21A
MQPSSVIVKARGAYRKEGLCFRVSAVCLLVAQLACAAVLSCPIAARGHLIGHLDRTIPGCKKDIDVLLKADMELRREAEVQQLLVVKEEQEWSPSVDQKDPEPTHIKEDQKDPEPTHIKEDQEEPEPHHIKEEQLQGLQEADLTKFTFTSVKSEDEEEAQSSDLHQRQTEQMETEGDGEYCGGPEPDRNSSPDTETSGSSQSEPEEDWMDPARKAFSCSFCAKTFKQRGNLNIHMRTHMGVKPFGCSLCSKRFTQKAGLDYHLKIHTGEKPFGCSLCGKNFRHKGAVTSHMTTHSEVKPFNCSICKNRFRAESQLRVHKCVGERPRFLRGRAGRRGEPLSCSECDATFPNNYLLVTHVRMHRGKKLFTCSVCGQKRQFSSHLAIHMRTHTGEKPFRCSVCGKRFSQRGIMSQHMAVHSGVKPFSCAVCGRRFFWHFQIKKHKCLGELSRFKGGDFIGEDCDGEEAAGSSEPVRHPEPGTNKETKPSYVEDIVDIEFWKETRKHQSGFTYQRNRKISVDDGFKSSIKTFSCSDDRTEAELTTDDGGDGDQPPSGPKPLESEQVFARDRGYNTDIKPSSLSECHRRSEDGLTMQTHGNSPAGEKQFGCLFCGKAPATVGYLSRHIPVHIREKTLSCVVRQERFSPERDLVDHKCTGEPSQFCDDAGLTDGYQSTMGFNLENQLQVPIRLHTGLKPFGCSVCGRTFAEHDSLRSHVMCHSAEKPFRCSVCNTGCSDSEDLVQHMRSHARQTQFSCTVCGKEFAWRRHLEKHLEVHSRDKVYSCRYCKERFSWHYQLKYHQCVGHRASQLHQRQIGEHREAEPPEGDREDSEGPQPDQHSDIDNHPEPYAGESSEPETEDSADSHFWEESCGRLSGFNSLKKDVPQGNGTFINHYRKSPRGGDPSTEGGSPDWHKDPEPPHTKEEQEDLWTSQEAEQLQGLEEADIKISFTVKSEGDEEEAQSSQLNQRQTQQMETEGDGEDCGGPEPDRNSHPEPATDDSVDSDFWKETREPQSGLYSLKRTEISDTILGCHTLSKDVGAPERDHSVDSDFWKDNRMSALNSLNSSRVLESETRFTVTKPYTCSECGKRFHHNYNLRNHMMHHTGEKAFFCSMCGLKCLYKSHLEIHMRTHTREKPFPCSVCGKRYAHKASMQSHMAVHTVEKQYVCGACGRGFAWYTELKYHQCAGESPPGSAGQEHIE